MYYKLFRENIYVYSMYVLVSIIRGGVRNYEI